ncbi:poly-beta-1,6-N-acetyl-D-glucosamine biosynthesis protein PgaD [Citrobacter cronae]|uniref:poly-beta-1,6-N-acetyl-D-glucosamine biosynthesis protein PgaD n=1 Tax=Citrobacter TaxID=544 RepID=UPI00195BFB9A|nr:MULTISPECIES: poly-beta-1,6-N-acetyl-D-glucosamine biosynthesis protein PgaD [Citrobacter]MBU5602430.1 poly-beta-1,6-N-acetyl-D-glucosamine biosynthesis protein PgaD [Citrobacter sp. S55_ASV_140]
MSQPLIFTERRLLPRIIDVLLTIFAWVGFLYLIYKGLITALAHSPYMGVRPFFTTLDTVTFYILVALVNGLVLIGWAKYNQFRFRVERRSRRPGLEEHELAESLRITRELVTELNKARVLTVHHHENGEISHIDVDKHIADNRLPPPTPAMLEYLPPEREPSLQKRPE